MELVDLSHVVEDGMTTYPGLPGPEVGVHLDFDESHATYDEGTEFTIGRLTMVANTGRGQGPPLASICALAGGESASATLTDLIHRTFSTTQGSRGVDCQSAG